MDTERLSQALRDLYGDDRVSARDDPDLRREIRRHFNESRRWRLVAGRRWFAAAAAVALAATAWWVLPGAVGRAFDIDGDGRVDVVDVLALELDLRAGRPVPASKLDLDGSGAVDSTDARRLLERIVALDGADGASGATGPSGETES